MIYFCLSCCHETTVALYIRQNRICFGVSLQSISKHTRDFSQNYFDKFKFFSLNRLKLDGFLNEKAKISLAATRGGVEDTRLEAKDTKKIRGQGQGQGQPFRGQNLSRPKTGMLEAKAKDQGHSRKCSSKKKVFKKVFQTISSLKA